MISVVKLSEDTRKKMSIAKMGNQYGKNKKGTKLSDKTREKMSKSHQGKKHSEETKKKISNSLKRRRDR